MNRQLLLAALTLVIMESCTTKTNNSTAQEIFTATTKTENKMTDSKNYTATILVDQKPEIAFNAIKNFRAWWSEEIEGNTDQLNEEFFYHYKDIHLCKIKLIESVANKKLVYLVTDNSFNFVKDKTEWVGTKLIFDITTADNKTKVHFTHEGLVPEYECYNVCNDAWNGYINKSLYDLITIGKGNPNPKDKDGFNAELAEKWKLK
jgi:hypothetical protein